MSDLVINHNLIKAPIIDILKQIKKEITNGKLKDIEPKHSYVRVTCPHHKGGQENTPACSVYCGDDPNIEYGTTNCFACGFKGPLWHFVAECFDEDDEFGKE